MTSQYSGDFVYGQKFPLDKSHIHCKLAYVRQRHGIAECGQNLQWGYMPLRGIESMENFYIMVMRSKRNFVTSNRIF